MGWGIVAGGLLAGGGAVGAAALSGGGGGSKSSSISNSPDVDTTPSLKIAEFNTLIMQGIFSPGTLQQSSPLNTLLAEIASTGSIKPKHKQSIIEIIRTELENQRLGLSNPSDEQLLGGSIWGPLFVGVTNKNTVQALNAIICIHLAGSYRYPVHIMLKL